MERKLIVGIAAAAGLSMLAFGLLELFFGNLLIASIDLVSGLSLCFIALHVFSTGNANLGRRLFAITVVATGYLIIISSDGQSIGVAIAVPAFVFLFALIEEKGMAIVWFVVSVSLIGLGAWMDHRSGAQISHFDQQWLASSYTRTPFIIAVLVIVVAFHYKKLIFNYQLKANNTQQALVAATARAQYDAKRLSDFLSLAADGFWESDADNQVSVVRANPSLHGETPLEQAFNAIVSSKRFRALVHSQDRFYDQEFSADGAGERLTFSVSGTPDFDSNNAFAGFHGVVLDLSPRIRMEKQLEHDAATDQLTGMLKRRPLLYQFENELQFAKTAATKIALAYIDLDGFKLLNDTLGHDVGDRVLALVGELLNQSSELSGRLGGDEFCCVFLDWSVDEVLEWSEDVKSQIARLPAQVCQRVDLEFGASIGIAWDWRVTTTEPDVWMHCADTAMYEAKRTRTTKLVRCGASREQSD